MKRSTIGWIVGIIFLICGIAFFCSRSESVETYRDRLIAQVNRELINPNNAVRKRIESAHVTVTATSARVTACTVQTVNGSNKAGKNGSNISEVDMVITVFWDGWIQKNGFTEIEFVYDPQQKQVKQTKYLRSNAAINWETMDWYSVGFAVGAWIAAAG